MFCPAQVRGCDQKRLRDGRLESRPNPQTRMSALRSAGFPACGFWGHSCPQFQELRPHPLLITPQKSPAESCSLKTGENEQNIGIALEHAPTLCGLIHE